MIYGKFPSGEEFRLCFAYSRVEGFNGHPTDATTALLQRWPPGEVPPKGERFFRYTVVRYYKDPPNREAGRKAAITRLLHTEVAPSLSREERASVWEAYFSRGGKK